MNSHSNAMRSPREVIIIGLGEVAMTHLRALESIPDLAVMAGIDPNPPKDLTFRGRHVPVHTSLQDAAAWCTPALVVIATPTPTHAAVCEQVTEVFPAAEILIEKPAADNHADARQLLGDLAASRVINVAYHMAHSPEVTWGHHLTTTKSDVLGPLVAIVASFADPYEGDSDAARDRYGTSWIDSGINALSVIDRFTEPIERTSLRTLADAPQSIFEAHITCHTAGSAIDALILTSWHVTAPTRTTRIKYASGAELVLDHHAVAGYLIHNGIVTEHFGSDGRIPRRESHYRALYNQYLLEGKPPMPAEHSLHLHNLLLHPEN